MLSHINNGRELSYFRHKSCNQLERETGNVEELSELFGQGYVGIHIIAQLQTRQTSNCNIIAGVKFAYLVLMIV